MAFITRKRKHAALLLSTAMLGSLAVGCSDGGGTGGASGTNKPEASSGASPSTSSPEASQQTIRYPASLTYWVNMDGDASATMKSYAEMELYKELEKKTGTKVEFQHPAGEAAEQINLLLASGKLPDVIYYNWNSIPKGPDNAIKEKTILRLNELIEQHAPNISKFLKENPDLQKLITTDEGNIYEVPFLSPDSYSRVVIGPVLRKDWLDKVGLPVPTTIEQWHTVLKAFKEKDPNGNGKNDEIPMLLDNLDAWASAWGLNSGFYLEGGKVKYGPIDPRYKEFLTTMNAWYKEGLIDKEYAATDSKLRDAKVSSDTLGSFVAYVASGIGKYIDMVKPERPSFDLAGTPFPVLKEGDTNKFGLISSSFAGFGAAISGSNKNPEATIKWLDYGYSQEGHMLYNFGVEGKSYKMANNVPTFTDEIMNNSNKLPKTQALFRYALSPSSGPFVYNKAVMEQMADKPQQKQAKQEWAKATGENLMPPVTLTAEENAKVASAMNDINTYFYEMIDKFIMGAEPIDNFDAYIGTIKGMGIDEAIKLQQAALDRFNNRK